MWTDFRVMSHIRHKQSNVNWFQSHAARKSFWNPVGVEPVHWKLAHIDLGSRVSGTNRERTPVRSSWNKSNKRLKTGSKPASKKLLTRLIRHTQSYVNWFERRVPNTVQTVICELPKSQMWTITNRQIVTCESSSILNYICNNCYKNCINTQRWKKITRRWKIVGISVKIVTKIVSILNVVSNNFCNNCYRYSDVNGLESRVINTNVS